MYACMQHIARAFLNYEECSNPGKILSWWHISYSCRLRYETTRNKKRVSCFATLLQNELKSDVARFITHIKPFLQQIRLLTGLNMDSKTCNIAIQLVLLPCCKTSYTFLFAIFSLPLGVDETCFWLRGDENLLNSVLYWKKRSICYCLYGKKVLVKTLSR